MEKESISPQILIPDEDIMEQSIKALYREIQTLRNTVRSQEEQLKAMAVELLLIGRWKPIDSADQLLGFQNQCYVVANYDFVNRVSTGTSENPDMVDLKRQIYELFNRCFLPSYVNCCCETEIGLNTVLINTPNLGQQRSSVGGGHIMV